MVRSFVGAILAIVLGVALFFAGWEVGRPASAPAPVDTQFCQVVRNGGTGDSGLQRDARDLLFDLQHTARPAAGAQSASWEAHVLYCLIAQEKGVSR